jgi:hypothetical protein
MSVPTVVGVAELPEAIRAADTLERVDYADHCTVEVAGAADRTPEEWARVILEQTPTGRRAPLLWRLLGLRLGPSGSAQHVQGWRIADRGESWIRVETSSWYMTGHAVALVDGDQLSIALFLRYDNPIAALIWRPVGALHRRGLPVMLRQAVRR